MGNASHWSIVRRAAALCLVCAATLGCAAKVAPLAVRSAVSEAGAADKAGTVALPFLMVVKHRNDGRIVTWPDPALTDRLAALLLENGYTLLDRAKVGQVLSELGLRLMEIERRADLPELGKELGADVLVFARLVLVEAQDGRLFENKVTLRGVRLSDGQVLFSLSAVDTTPYRHLSAETLLDAGLTELTDTRPSASASEPPAASAEAKASIEVKK